MKSFFLLILALVFIATGCKTANHSGSEESGSEVKDFGNPDTTTPQKISVVVPQGGSTTALLALQVPITTDAVRVSTNCNLQLVQLLVRNNFGQIGQLKQSQGDQTRWFAASGNTHTITHVQFVVNNFGAPSLCSLSIAKDVQPAIDPVFQVFPTQTPEESSEGN